MTKVKKLRLYCHRDEEKKFLVLVMDDSLKRGIPLALVSPNNAKGYTLAVNFKIARYYFNINNPYSFLQNLTKQHNHYPV